MAGIARPVLIGLGVLVIVLGLLALAIDLEPVVDREPAPAEPVPFEPGPSELGPSGPAPSGPAPSEPGPDRVSCPVAVVPTAATIRFRLPTRVGAGTVHLVGEFNDWSTDAHPLVRQGDWFHTDLRLELGRTYRYRYLLDGCRWENSWDADAYVPNDFGSHDSVLDLTRSPAATDRSGSSR